MIFTDVSAGPGRAAAVMARLDPDRGWVLHGATVSWTASMITLDAGKGVLWCHDTGGEQRIICLPSEISADAVAAIMNGLLTFMPVRVLNKNLG